MPLITITYSDISIDTLQKIAKRLPHIVSEAIECPEEPYDEYLKPGDVDIRFHERSPLDTGGLPLVIEVHTKYYESRATNRQQRSDMIYNQLSPLVQPIPFGVFLILPVAAWSEGED